MPNERVAKCRRHPKVRAPAYHLPDTTPRIARVGSLRAGGSRIGALWVLAGLCILSLCTASDASAGLGIGATPTLPSVLVVGQANVPASLTIVNASDGREATGGVSVDQITFIPSCRSIACPAADVDPGVLRLGVRVTGALAERAADIIRGCIGRSAPATDINSWTPRG